MLQVLGSWYLVSQRACPVGGGVLVVNGDAGLTTSFPWVKPMGDLGNFESESGGLKPLAVCIPWIYTETMTTTLQAWGNSQGVRIPKALLAALHLKKGMRLELDLSPKKDAIIVKPAGDAVSPRGRHRIEDLVSKMPRNYKAKEFFGDAIGGEVW